MTHQPTQEQLEAKVRNLVTSVHYKGFLYHDIRKDERNRDSKQYVKDIEQATQEIIDLIESIIPEPDKSTWTGDVYAPGVVPNPDHSKSLEEQQRKLLELQEELIVRQIENTIREREYWGLKLEHLTTKSKEE